MTRTHWPRVLVSILHWSDPEATMRCIESLFASDYRAMRVVVTDNASPTPLPPDFKDRYPSVELIQRAQNLGFAGGHNAVMDDPRHTDCAYIWLLNNDCVVQPGCLASLIEEAEGKNDIGLVSPVIRYLDDPERIEFAIATFDWNSFSCPRIRNWQEIERLSRESPQDIWLTGTAMLIPRSVLNRIGQGLDERLFAYFEDNDISLRVARLGLCNTVSRKAAVLHASPSSNASRNAHYHYLMARNEWLFWMRSLPTGRKPSFVMNFLASTLESAAALSFSPERSSARLAGAWDGMLDRSGAPRLRRYPDLLIRLLPPCSRIFPPVLRWTSRLLRFIPGQKAKQ
jgi:GT2 family glycosyltransferase